MSNRFRHVLAGMLAIAAIPVSYGLAVIGEPSSMWLWRDILGIY